MKFIIIEQPDNWVPKAKGVAECSDCSLEGQCLLAFGEIDPIYYECPLMKCKEVIEVETTENIGIRIPPDDSIITPIEYSKIFAIRE